MTFFKIYYVHAHALLEERSSSGGDGVAFLCEKRVERKTPQAFTSSFLCIALCFSPQTVCSFHESIFIDSRKLFVEMHTHIGAIKTVVDVRKQLEKSKWQ